MPNKAATAAIPPVLYCCQILLSSSATKCSQSSSEISSAFLPFKIREDLALLMAFFLTFNFRESFLPRRGRVNCSLNDNGKWRWFGAQFIVKEN